MTASLFSQAVVEVGVQNAAPTSEFSQVVVEAGVTLTPRTSFSQVVLEVGRPYAVESPSVAGSRQLWPRGGDAIPGAPGPSPGGAAGGIDVTGDYPDGLTVVGLQGRPISATAPAVGDTWSWNGSLWVPTASSSVNKAFGPTGPRTTPPASGWSWFQQESSAVATSSRDGSIHLNVPNKTTNHPSARMRSAPSTPYTIIANMEAPLLAANYIAWGLCFGNAGSEIRMLYYGYVDGRIDLYIVGTSGGDIGGATFGPLTLRNQLTFFALRDDGTNKKYYVGVEEENMIEIFSEARTTQFTPTQIGFWAAPRQNTYRVRLTLWSWTEQSGAPL